MQRRSNYRGTRFKGTRGLWELLTRKNVNIDVITKSDLKAFKRILELTNAHLVGYEPGGDIQVSRGIKYAKIIAKLFNAVGGHPVVARYGSTGQRFGETTPRSKMAFTSCA